MPYGRSVPAGTPQKKLASAQKIYLHRFRRWCIQDIKPNTYDYLGKWIAPRATKLSTSSFLEITGFDIHGDVRAARASAAPRSTEAEGTLPGAAWCLRKHQLHDLSLAEFSGEPILHLGSQGFDIYLEARFDPAIGRGQDVVKRRSSCEAPHGETVEPRDRTRPPAHRFHDVHLDLAREHLSI